MIWINGQVLDDDDARISPRDLGLLHAAGVFTTMRASQRRVWRLDQHLQRLRASCEALAIPLTYADTDLSAACDALLDAASLDDARLRLTVTRGVSRHEPDRGTIVEPTVLLSADPRSGYPDALYEAGMTVTLLDQWKLNPYDPQAGHKTLDYLSRFAALHHAHERGAHEAIWFNVHNYAQCASMGNLFLVSAGKLRTAPTQAELDASESLRNHVPYPRSSVLPGTTRGFILESSAAMGIEVELGAIDVNQLLEADEVFLTNSMMLVMPVCRIERHEVGPGKPGELTQRLMHHVRASAG